MTLGQPLSEVLSWTDRDVATGWDYLSDLADARRDAARTGR